MSAREPTHDPVESDRNQYRDAVAHGGAWRRQLGVLALTLSLLAALALVVGASPAAAQDVGPDFAGGDGSADNPYEIDSWEHLNDTRLDLSANYTLLSDLSDTTTGYDTVASETANGGSGFHPIGNISTAFTGTFDGQGHTIADLQFNRSAVTYVGLFGDIGSDGAVSNLTLADVNLNIEEVDNSVFPEAGPLAGTSDGSITNVATSGAVTTPYSSVGGLVGWNNGTVTRSSSATTVNETGGNNDIGGLVGRNTGTITESYATGTVRGGNNLGGLIGYNDDQYGQGIVTDSYATGGAVDGGNGAGGLVGQNVGPIERSYASGPVSGSISDGGLVGDIVVAGTTDDSYWDVNTTGKSSSESGTNLTTAEMKGTPATGNMSGFDFSSTWDVLTPGSDDAVSYPFLQNNTQTPAPGREAVTSCGLTLDTPGEQFELGNDVTTTSDVVCVDITADDVVFDGNGLTIQGAAASENPGEAVGIRISGQNVTVRNVTVSDWRDGVEVTGDGATVENLTATDNVYSGVMVDTVSNATLNGIEARNTSTDDFVSAPGIALIDTTNSTVTDAVVLDNADAGLQLIGSSSGNQIADVTASGNDPGIDVAADAVSNTLSGIRATDNSRAGITMFGENTTLRDSVANSNDGIGGVYLASSTRGQANNSRIINVTANQNPGDGFYLNRPENVTLVEVTARNNTNGVYFFRATDNTVRNSTFRDNADWAVGQDSAETLVNRVERVDLGASTAPATTVSAEIQNARLRAVAGSQPANPNATAIGRYVAVNAATPFGESAALRNVSLSYAAGDSSDAQNLTLWVEDGGWQFVPESAVNTTARTVTGDVVEEVPDSGTVTLGAFEFDNPYFTTTVTDANDPVTVGETVNVTVAVDNLGNGAGTQTVSLGYDSDGDDTPDTLADSQNVTVAPNETETVTLAWETGEDDFGDAIDIAVSSANATSTDTVTVRKDPSYEVAVVGNAANPSDIADAIRAGLDDAGVLGDYRLTTEPPANVTGSNASAAADTYDVIVANDFREGGGEVESVETASDDGHVGTDATNAEIAALYDEADNRTGIVSLDNFDGFEPLSTAIEARADPAVRGDPQQVVQSDVGNAPVQFNILQNHALFEGLGVSNGTVDVYTAGEIGADRAWFQNFTGGVTLANVSHAGTDGGDGPGAAVTDDEDEVLLSLGALGTFSANPSPDGQRILANAVRFLTSAADVTVQPMTIDNRTDSASSTVDVTVEELADVETENLSVRLVVDAPNSTEVYNQTIAPGEVQNESLTVTFGADVGTPELGPLPAADGSYTATATATANGTEPATATEQFRVIQGSAEPGLGGLDVAGQGPNATITAGDDEDVTVNVTNAGDQAGSFEVNASIGAAVDAVESTGTIAPGGTETVTFENVTGDLAAGTYQVNVSLDGETVNGSLSVLTPGSFQVENPTVSDGRVPIGTPINVTATVTNTGEATETKAVTLTAGNLTETQNLTLAGGATETVLFQGVDTGAVGIGEFAYAIETPSNATSGNLTVTDLIYVESYDVASTVFLDGTLTVNATVQNDDTVERNLTVPLAVGNETVDTSAVTLAPGANTTATLTWQPFGMDWQPPSVEATVSVVDLDPTTVSVVGPDIGDNGNPAGDTMDDGLLDDVAGTDDTTPFDVQLLFNELDSPLLETYPELFNFQGEEPDRVNVFDVQALFSLTG